MILDGMLVPIFLTMRVSRDSNLALLLPSRTYISIVLPSFIMAYKSIMAVNIMNISFPPDIIIPFNALCYNLIQSLYNNLDSNVNEQLSHNSPL